MQEQRLHIRLTDYWQKLKKDNILPAIAQFNSHTVPDLWPNCLVVAVEKAQATGVSFKYTYIGQPITQMFGQDLTGQLLDPRRKDFPIAVIAKKLTEVMEVGDAIQADNHFNNAQGKLVKYRGCFLPFGSDKTGITHILVGISHRVF